MNGTEQERIDREYEQQRRDEEERLERQLEQLRKYEEQQRERDERNKPK